MSKYVVKEIFNTIQGEGYHAGRSAVFVRFTGCNLWNGYDEDRKQFADSTGAMCPMWCDTDFTKSGAMVFDSAQELAERIKDVRYSEGLIVFTGGEPLLQLDVDLIAEIREILPDVLIAVETNGTVSLRKVMDNGGFIDWITCSPKLPEEMLKLELCNEVKLVIPDYLPSMYTRLSALASHRYIQIEDGSRYESSKKKALELLRHTAEWKLSVQIHKILKLQ